MFKQIKVFFTYLFFIFIFYLLNFFYLGTVLFENYCHFIIQFTPFSLECCTNVQAIHALQKGVPIGFHKLAIYHYDVICFIYWKQRIFKQTNKNTTRFCVL